MTWRPALQALLSQNGAIPGQRGSLSSVAPPAVAAATISR